MELRTLRLLLVACLVVILSACQTQPRHRLHNRVVETPDVLPAASAQMLMLPLSVKVKEMTAGGLRDEVGDWTREAHGHIHAWLAAGDKLAALPLDDIGAEEKAVVDEHIALFDVVAGSALAHTMTPPVDQAWQAKAKRFDYTIGPGLSFLADRTGHDKALFVFGEDVISSSGRKAAFIVAAAFGVGIPLGHSFLIAGIVDLRSGDILWMDYFVSAGDKTLRDRQDVDAILGDLFADYPGIDSYSEWAASP